MKLVFKAAYGDHDKDVELFEPFGSGGGFHIYIDRFYYGTIMLQQDAWTIHLNYKAAEELTTDDRSILIEIIENHAAQVQ